LPTVSLEIQGSKTSSESSAINSNRSKDTQFQLLSTCTLVKACMFENIMEQTCSAHYSVANIPMQAMRL